MKTIELTEQDLLRLEELAQAMYDATIPSGQHITLKRLQKRENAERILAAVEEVREHRDRDHEKA